MLKMFGLLTLVFFYILMATPLQSLAEGEKIATQKESQAKIKRYNIRLQYRKHFNNQRIKNEVDYQITCFSALPHRFFIFLDIESIFSSSSHYSTLSEFNISRPILHTCKYLDSIDWITRLEMETHMKSVVSLGIQWHIDRTPFLSDLTKRLKLKTFIQVFPLKTQDSRGDVDTYVYYTFLFPGGFAYTRGYSRYFFKTGDEKNYKMIAQDVIFPITKGGDIYVRYSYYEQERNKGIGAGVRYLIKF